jgi:hypothetical protein
MNSVATPYIGLKYERCCRNDSQNSCQLDEHDGQFTRFWFWYSTSDGVRIVDVICPRERTNWYASISTHL